MMSTEQTLHGELLFNEPLSRHTSWRVGGPARRFYRPTDIDDLAAFLQQLPADEPLMWLGLGSNLLIRDGGFPGTVIATAGRLQSIMISGSTVSAEVGAYCSKLARQAAKSALKGAAFWAGIPGTVGGALAMNAGAHGSETWDFVTQIKTVNRKGEIHLRSKSDFEVGYRHVRGFEDEWFVSATMQFAKGDAEFEKQQIRDWLKTRNASQPTNQPCAGSVFRNPPGDHAGRLIEDAGLKGLRIGDASVSEKHANFIVNNGEATASDIETLIQEVQQKVEQMSGIRLQPEVHIAGEFA